MANFIDFVVAVSKDKSLGSESVEIINKSSAQELSDWFKTKGFTISEEESKKLIDNKDSINDIKTKGTY